MERVHIRVVRAVALSVELAVVPGQNMDVLLFTLVQQLDGKVAVQHLAHILRIALNDFLHLLAADITGKIV